MPKATDSKTSTSRVDPLARAPPKSTKPRKGTTAWIAQSPGYLLRVTLRTDSPPSIIRLLRVPCGVTFARLHKILLVAFGWWPGRLHRFTIYTRDNCEVIDPCLPSGTPDPSHIMTLQENADWIREEMLSLIEAEAEVKGVTVADVLGAEEAAKMKESDDVELGEVFGLPVFGELGMKMTYEYNLKAGYEHEIEFLGIAGDDMELSVGMSEGQKVFCYGGEGRRRDDDNGAWESWCSKFGLPLVQRQQPDTFPWERTMEKMNCQLAKMKLGKVPRGFREY